MRKIKIHISGRMGGVEKFNYPLFNAVADFLVKQGFTVLNPTSLTDGKPPKYLDEEGYRILLRKNIYWLFNTADAQICLNYSLPKIVYGKIISPSKGAEVEAALARALDLPQHNLDDISCEGGKLIFNRGVRAFPPPLGSTLEKNKEDLLKFLEHLKATIN